MRLGDGVLRSVAFFGLPNGQGGVTYQGTGFFVEYQDCGHVFRYLVTAKHVAQNLSVDHVIRLNRTDGGSEKLPLRETDWTHHPREDVSVARFDAEDDFDVAHFNLRHRLTEEKRDTKPVQAGDITYIVGLFRLHAGDQRNLPLVHTGHIALAPAKDELIPLMDRNTRQTVHSYAYLVESQTLEGLSGSPVFVRRGVMAVQDPREKSAVQPLGYAAVFLLGVYLGSWDGQPGEILANDRRLESDNARVPVGIGAVAPADQIVEVLERPELRDARTDEIVRRRSFDRHE